MFLTALIRNITSQKQIRNNSLKQGTGGNPSSTSLLPLEVRPNRMAGIMVMRFTNGTYGKDKTSV